MKALPSLAGNTPSAASSPARPSTLANPLVSSTSPPPSEEPSPTDLLLATPPTLLKLFALSAPVIHAGATFVQLVTWTHPSFFGSLLVLLGWWAVCLFGYWVALYGVNAAVLVFILRGYLSARRAKTSASSSIRHRSRSATLSPAAYAQLINSAHILAEQVQSFRTGVIHPLSLHFSFTPLRPSTPAPAYATAWLCLTSYPFYLALTYFVPLKYIFLVLGSVAILWQAPFFTTLRTLLWRSAFVRWTFRLFLGVLRGGKGVRKEVRRTKSGIGIPGLIGSQAAQLGGRGGTAKGAVVVEEKSVKKPRSSSVVSSAKSSPPLATAGSAAPVVAPEKVAEEAALEEDIAVQGDEEDIQVQFTVFENQRWWVGLDWTHALLPGERASWTDPDNNPANPPSSFVLPAPSVAYIPSPTKSDPNSRLKKTTEWRWLDPEWHVLRSAVASVSLPAAGAGGPPVSPASPESSAVAASPPSPTLSRILGSASSAVASATSSSAPISSPGAIASPSFTTPTAAGLTYTDSTLFASWSVDDEGWQYGDNHFEKMGPRGGLGRYTRRRAWGRKWQGRE
ncbi:Peroxin/Dysferlin domain-containing protein [Rhodotorula toruloides]